MKNKFWQEVITAWGEYNIAIEHTGSFLGYTFLFSTYVHNRNTLHVYRIRDFISHNCTRISDLLLPNGHIMNYSDFISKYKLNSVNYLYFYTLRKKSLSLINGAVVIKRTLNVVDKLIYTL